MKSLSSVMTKMVVRKRVCHSDYYNDSGPIMPSRLCAGGIIDYDSNEMSENCSRIHVGSLTFAYAKIPLGKV